MKLNMLFAVALYVLPVLGCGSGLEVFSDCGDALTEQEIDVLIDLVDRDRALGFSKNEEIAACAVACEGLESCRECCGAVVDYVWQEDP